MRGYLLDNLSFQFCLSNLFLSLYLYLLLCAFRYSFFFIVVFIVVFLINSTSLVHMWIQFNSRILVFSLFYFSYSFIIPSFLSIHSRALTLVCAPFLCLFKVGWLVGCLVCCVLFWLLFSRLFSFIFVFFCFCLCNPLFVCVCVCSGLNK